MTPARKAVIDALKSMKKPIALPTIDPEPENPAFKPIPVGPRAAPRPPVVRPPAPAIRATADVQRQLEQPEPPPAPDVPDGVWGERGLQQVVDHAVHETQRETNRGGSDPIDEDVADALAAGHPVAGALLSTKSTRNLFNMGPNESADPASTVVYPGQKPGGGYPESVRKMRIDLYNGNLRQDYAEWKRQNGGRMPTVEEAGALKTAAAQKADRTVTQAIGMSEARGNVVAPIDQEKLLDDVKHGKTWLGDLVDTAIIPAAAPLYAVDAVAGTDIVGSMKRGRDKYMAPLYAISVPGYTAAEPQAISRPQREGKFWWLTRMSASTVVGAWLHSGGSWGSDEHLKEIVNGYDLTQDWRKIGSIVAHASPTLYAARAAKGTALEQHLPSEDAVNAAYGVLGTGAILFFDPDVTMSIGPLWKGTKAGGKLLLEQAGPAGEGIAKAGLLGGALAGGVRPALVAMRDAIRQGEPLADVLGSGGGEFKKVIAPLIESELSARAVSAGMNPGNARALKLKDAISKMLGEADEGIRGAQQGVNEGMAALQGASRSGLEATEKGARAADDAVAAATAKADPARQAAADAAKKGADDIAGKVEKLELDGAEKVATPLASAAQAVDEARAALAKVAKVRRVLNGKGALVRLGDETMAQVVENADKSKAAWQSAKRAVKELKETAEAIRVGKASGDLAAVQEAIVHAQRRVAMLATQVIANSNDVIVKALVRDLRLKQNLLGRLTEAAATKFGLDPAAIQALVRSGSLAAKLGERGVELSEQAILAGTAKEVAGVPARANMVRAAISGLKKVQAQLAKEQGRIQRAFDKEVADLTARGTADAAKGVKTAKADIKAADEVIGDAAKERDAWLKHRASVTALEADADHVLTKWIDSVDAYMEGLSKPDQIGPLGDTSRAAAAVSRLSLGRAPLELSLPGAAARVYRTLESFRRLLNPMVSRGFANAPKLVQDLIRRSINRDASITLEVDAVHQEHGLQGTWGYLLSVAQIATKGGPTVMNTGAASHAARALTYLRWVLAAGEDAIKGDAIFQALSRAYQPAGRIGAEQSSTAGRNLINWLTKNPDGTAEEFIDEVRGQVGVWVQQLGQADAKMNAERFILRAIAAGSNMHATMQEYAKIGAGFGDLLDPETAAKVFDFFAEGSDTGKLYHVRSALKAPERVPTPLPDRAGLPASLVDEATVDVAPPKAKIDIDQFFQDAQKIGLPMQKTLGSGRGIIDRFAIGHIDNISLMKAAEIEGRGIWMPSHHLEAMRNIPNQVAKELAQYTKANTADELVSSAVNAALDSWRLTSVYGWALPRAQHFFNTYFGDISLVGLSHGAGKAARYAASTSFAYVPFVGGRLQDLVSKSGLGAMTNPHLAHVLGGSDKVLVDVAEGPVSAQKLLQEFYEEGGWDSQPSAVLEDLARRASTSDGVVAKAIGVFRAVAAPAHIRATAKGMETIQKRARLAYWLDARTGRLTGTPMSSAEAGAMMRKTLYDFRTGASHFETKYISRLAAFWMYRRNMLRRLGESTADLFAGNGTEASRALKTAKVLAWLPDIASGGQEPQGQMSRDELIEAWGKPFGPWWADSQFMYTNAYLPVTDPRRRWYNERQGRDAPFEAFLGPSLDIMDMLTVANLTMQTMGAAACAAGIEAGLITNYTQDDLESIWSRNADAIAEMAAPGANELVRQTLYGMGRMVNRARGVETSNQPRATDKVTTAWQVVGSRFGDVPGATPDSQGTFRVDGMGGTALMSIPQLNALARDWALFDNPSMNEDLVKGLLEGFGRWSGILRPYANDPFRGRDMTMDAQFREMKAARSELSPR